MISEKNCLIDSAAHSAVMAAITEHCLLLSAFLGKVLKARRVRQRRISAQSASQTIHLWY